MAFNPLQKLRKGPKKKIEELVGKNNDEINALLRKYARTYLFSTQLGGGQHTTLPGVLYALQFPRITPAILGQIQNFLDNTTDVDKRTVLDPGLTLNEENWLLVLARLNALKKRIGALQKTHGYRYIGVTIQKPLPHRRRQQHESAGTESLVGLVVMLIKHFTAGAGAGAGI